MLDVPTSAEQVASTKVEQSPFLTEEEAGAQATNLYAAFFADELRSSHPPRVKNVRLLDPFRSTQDSSGGIYVVNFENNGGYIMMAEHRHGEPILAACPQGNFDPEKALDNPNFAPILANMRALVAAGPQQGDVDGKLCPPDTPGPDPNPRDPWNPGPRDPDYPNDPRNPDKPEPPEEPKKPKKPIRKFIGFYYGPWKSMGELPDLIPVKWGQGKPFNNYLPKRKDGTDSDAGCVPTAVAQILSCYRYPKDLNWGLIISKSKNRSEMIANGYVSDALATLFNDLGGLFGIEYEKTSGAFGADVPKVLAHYDIISHPTLQEYDGDVVYQELKERRPVYMQGCSIRMKNANGGYDYKPGHAWVLDGYKVLSRMATERWYVWLDDSPFIYTEDRDDPRWRIDGVQMYQNKLLLHCNWGWDGSRGGYYLDKIFNTNKGSEIKDKEEEEELRSTEEGTEYNYQYDLWILTGIQPKR